MKKRKTTYQRPFLIALLLCGYLLLPLYGQELDSTWNTYQLEEIPRRDFDEAAWRELTKDLDYSQDRQKKKKEPEEDTASGRGDNAMERFFSRGFSPEVGDAIMKGFIVLAALLLFIFLLRTLIRWRQRPRDKQFTPGVTPIDISRIEENIHESDLDGFIRQARLQQDYALAIRLYYLAILKSLSQGKLIHWKKDKTNRDYGLELRSHPLASEFTQLTGIFERTWYGRRPLSGRQYEEMEPRFQGFIQKATAGTTETKNEATGPTVAKPS